MASSKSRQKQSQEDSQRASGKDKKQAKTQGNAKAKKSSSGKAKVNEKKRAAHYSPVPRPFWTGVVAFGLVTLPVSLYPASRGKQGSLHMVDQTGTRLNRRYQCSKEQTMLSSDDIVRGYEVEKDQFITVADDELKALAPEKSNEINLQQFVKLDDIDPIYFNKGYFLAPDKDAIKAYRLLAESMERENRAGIATFVMRDREYLVAIISEEGILRAETLRFYDEIRSPEDIGLEKINTLKPDSKKITEASAKMQKTFKAMTTKELDRNKLYDRQTEKTKLKAQEKLESHQDIVTEKPSKKTGQTPQEPPRDSAQIIDLMQVIKARMRGEKLSIEEEDNQATKPKPDKIASSTKTEASRGSAVHKTQPTHSPKNESKNELEGMPRSELYERAQALEISGRSKMSKQELIHALSHQNE